MPLFDGPLENRPVDPSEEFNKQHNHFFTVQKHAGFDPRSAFGKIRSGGRDFRSNKGSPTIR